ncbi:MAG TPA: diversity-generating retroelement protein bAvd family protein [Cytophagales bacterium]|nr:diversity-generating retroelement protein bAvd family protein [Cytophagales bacterium]
MHNFKQLTVWQKSMDLVEEIYQISSTFPSEEKFGLTSQIRRCSVSIPSNIAEGSGRNSDKEFVQFLKYSVGSAFEVETQLLLAHRLGLINGDDLFGVESLTKEVQKMLHGFIKKLENNG